MSFIYNIQNYKIPQLMNNVELPSLFPAQQLFPIDNTQKIKNQKFSTPQSIIKPSTAGTKMIGNYILGKQIGSGTFGKVHFALHLPTNEKVAVKIIDKINMRKIDILRVERQMTILRKVYHRHIVQLYQIIQTKKSLLFFQEYLPNGELFKEIIKKKRLTELQACKYFQQIISAVQYLHKNKIAHRDLKLENILIDYDNQIKIIDFGLSSQYNKNGMSTFCGSPCYAAPEIIQGKKFYDPLAADLWSCGVILFTMIAGYLPFCQTNVNSLFKKIVSCNYKMPNFISASAINLIQNLLVLNPGSRLSIKAIKSHEWFRQISMSPAYGLNNNEYIAYSRELINNLQKLGLQINYFKELNIQNNEKNKTTANYFILMKKLIKDQELIPQYIGNDNFNPNLIIKNKKAQSQSETQLIQIVINQNQIDLVKQIQKPPEVGVNQYPKITQNIDQIQLIENQELIKIIKNIYQVIFNQFFIFEGLNRKSVLKQKNQKLIESQFYKGNLNLKKVGLNLNAMIQKRSLNRLIIEENNPEGMKKKMRVNISQKSNQSCCYKSNNMIDYKISNKSNIKDKYNVYLTNPMIRIHKSINFSKVRSLIKNQKRSAQV